ncbi:MAG: FAD-dependent oxidoreductase [Saprospiraceae bacterium]|nr:FAD-dependent oxidoreductase [Saprospiraceae bacterium]
MRHCVRILQLVFFVIHLIPGLAQVSQNYDIVIYGGNSSGVAAAIQASRMGKKVVLLEPTNRIGGLTTGGLGQTDIGNKQAIGGISREFYQNVKKYYQNPGNWKFQKKENYKDGGQTTSDINEDAMWTFEPSAALKILKEMLAKELKITLEYGQRLDRVNGVKKFKGKIVSVKMESGNVYKGKMYIDASYEGDLMASAGVRYSIGRESNDEYQESLNGVQNNDTSLTLKKRKSNNGVYHNFKNGVDPYVVKGKPESGLLPFIEVTHPPSDGTGDKKIQAYCFRMCLTDFEDNRIPFEMPSSYNELDYELLFRNYEAGETAVPWINSSMPNRKTDTNNSRGFSTDFIGQNYEYPEADYNTRKLIVEKHLNYQKGLMWSLAYHPRIPAFIREQVSKWGLCKDEFEEGNGWPSQLYVREARRMKSDYVMTQSNCEGLITASDPVGMAAYGMDSHNTQRFVTKDGFVRNEGNVEAHGSGPYPISYQSIIPKKEECSNLLVPVCLSSTHIAFGSIRMEPVFMVLGQSAAVAASLSIDKKVAVQNLPYKSLHEALRKYKQVLGNKE